MSERKQQPMKAHPSTERPPSELPLRRRHGLTYRSPRLTVLGDLRGMTFGGSPGLNDSGSTMTQEPPD